MTLAASLLPPFELLAAGIAIALVTCWPRRKPTEWYWHRRARLDRKFEKRTGRAAPGVRRI